MSNFYRTIEKQFWWYICICLGEWKKNYIGIFFKSFTNCKLKIKQQYCEPRSAFRRSYISERVLVIKNWNMERRRNKNKEKYIQLFCYSKEAPNVQLILQYFLFMVGTSTPVERDFSLIDNI